MKRTLFLGSMCAAAAAAIATSWGGFASAKAKMQDGNLVVKFSYDGVTPGQVENFSIAATSTAVYACVDANNRPLGHGTPETVTKTTYAEGLFMGNADGVVKQEILSMSPPEPGSFTCADAHKKMLASASYTDVRVRNISDDVAKNIKGTYTRHIIWMK